MGQRTDGSPLPRITLVPEDQARGARSASLKGKRVAGDNHQGSRAHREGTLLEVLHVVDVKDPVVTLLLRPIAIPLGVIEGKRKNKEEIRARHTERLEPRLGGCRTRVRGKGAFSEDLGSESVGFVALPGDVARADPRPGGFGPGGHPHGHQHRQHRIRIPALRDIDGGR